MSGLVPILVDETDGQQIGGIVDELILAPCDVCRQVVIGGHCYHVYSACMHFFYGDALGEEGPGQTQLYYVVYVDVYHREDGPTHEVKRGESVLYRSLHLVLTWNIPFRSDQFGSRD